MQNFKLWIESRFPEASWRPSRLVGNKGETLQIDGGYIDIQSPTQWSPRSQSVIDFFVDEKKRNQGMGDWLVKQAKSKYKDLGAQVSSMASLKIFYKNGFRNPEIPHGTFEDHVKKFQMNGSSVFVAMNDENGRPYINSF